MGTDLSQWLVGHCTLLRGGAGGRIGEHSIGPAYIGRPAVTSKKMTKSFPSLGNGKTLKFFRSAPMEGTSRRATVPAGNGARQAGHGEKVKKNDKVFSFLRKRKNFEIFSTCSDGGDIEAGDVACQERGMAGRPWGKSQKNDKVFCFLRKRKNFEIFRPAPMEGTSRRATVRGPVVSSAGRRTPVPGGLIKSHRACADRQARGLAYPTLPGFSLC